MKKSDKIIEMLSTGNFTLAYHDQGYCALYKGKRKYEDLEEGEELKEFSNHRRSDYIPEEVVLLVKMLGGKVVSV